MVISIWTDGNDMTDINHIKNPDEWYINFIFTILFGICFISSVSIALFVRITTSFICCGYNAQSFLSSVSVIPGNTRLMFTGIIFLMLSMAASYCVREIFRKKYIALITFIIDIVLSFWIMGILNFNYNGVVLWVLANILLYTLNNRRKIVSIIVICAGMFVYLCSDFGLLSIVLDLYSIHDYINFYDDKVNQIYLLGLYDFFQIGTIVCFIVFCTTTLISKQDSLHKINDLYLQLTQAHANLKTANHEIEKYMFEQVKTIEIQERNRLAREIHDTVGHTLAGIVAGLDACNTLMQSNSDKFNQQLKLVTDMAREGVLEIRRSVNHLRPDSLERLSLESAIRRLVNNTESVTGIHVMFSSTVRNFDLDEDEELAVYRIIQESITNAIKHSHADTIDLKIQKSENAIRISIHDNGIGCPDIHFGFGLSHMQSRIEMLHGELKVWTENGFSIEAVIPLRKNLEAEQ